MTAKYNHIIHTISGMMQLHETGVNDDLPYSMIIFTGVFRLEQNKIFSVFIWSGLSILLTMIMTTILLPK